MTDWFTSDTHFNHERIIALANRPFDTVEEMNETMISNWNARVAPGDRVFHLGDFGFENVAIRQSEYSLDKIDDRLNGNKTLIRGNHDKPLHRLESIFDEVLPYMGYQGFWMEHKPRFFQGGLNLCGHIHQQWVAQGNNLNMSVEVWGYQPVTMEEIEDRIDWVRNDLYDTYTEMKMFKKGFEEIFPPIP